MTIELTAAIGGLRAGFDLLRGAVAARDDAKVQAALIDANTRLLDLSMAALALSEKNNALLAQLTAAQGEARDLKTKAQDRTAYALHEIRPGAFVYASQPVGEGPNQATHYLCQPCYDKGVKSVLRSMGSGAWLTHRCPADSKHEIAHVTD